jgi:hypothetical protein
MLSLKARLPASFLAALLVATGCDNLVQPARGPQEPAEFSSIRLVDVSMADARAEALAVMKERFRLDSTASTATVLISRPLETTDRADRETAGIREVLSGSSNRHRQIAQVHLVERGPDVLVSCNVRVQRLDVAERSAFLPQRSAEDRPSNLPSERAPGTQTLLEEDWSNVGRNRQLEQDILSEIADRLAPAIAGTPAEGATAPPPATRPTP